MSLYGGMRTPTGVYVERNHVHRRGKKDALWLNDRRQAKSVDSRISDDQLHTVATRSRCIELSAPGSDLQRLCDQGQLEMAMDVLLHMEHQGTAPSLSMYDCLLKACAKRKALAQTRRVLAHLADHGPLTESTRFLGQRVVSTLVKCGDLENALQVFDRLPHRDVVSWTAVLSGYTACGRGREALKLFQCMQQEGVQPNAFTFVSLLKACGSIGDLEKSKRIHAQVLKYGCQSDLFVGNCLVDMYGKCGSTVDARNAFDALPRRDVVSWNAMLTAYAQHGQPEKALQLYEQMQQDCVNPSSRTFVSVLQACGMLAEKNRGSGPSTRSTFLDKGKAIHADVQNRGYDSDVFIGNTLISMYGKWGTIVDAQQVFDGLLNRDVVSWNAMLAAYVDQGQAEKALQLYEQMRDEGISPDKLTFVIALQACGMCADKDGNSVVDGRSVAQICLEKGRRIHADAQMKGYNSYIFVSNTLVSMYGKCRSIADAQNVFDELSHHDVVGWTALLSAYVEQGQAEKVLQLYEQMQEEGVSPNDRTLVTATQACSMIAEKENDINLDGQYTRIKTIIAKGKALHQDAQRRAFYSDVFVVSTLISMYGKCGSIVDAQNVLDRFSQNDVVPRNALMAAFVEQGEAEKALQLYEQMLETGVSPSNLTFMSALQACGILAEKQDAVMDSPFTNVIILKMGKAIHADAWSKGYESDLFIGNTLASLYGKVGSIVDAHTVFDRLPKRDVVSWNVMLAAHVEQEQAEKALHLYDMMRKGSVSPNECTFVITLQACGMFADKEVDFSVDKLSIRPKCLQVGKALHAAAQRLGYSAHVLVGNSLVTMYGRCGSIVDAQNVFDGLCRRDVVAWTSMLAAYVEQGQGEKALQLHIQMQQEGVSPDDITTVWVLQACSNSGSLSTLRQIHQTLASANEGLSPFLVSSLITAYGRCASTVAAQAVFDTVPKADVVSWNALIACYARQGNCVASLLGFKKMQVEGVKPNGVTFLSLLSACSHSGAVDKGVEYFESLSRDHGLTPEIEHYVCMVDLFGRAGFFNRIEELLSTMPMQPNLATWLCLLGSCQKHGMVVLGEHAFDRAVRLQPKHAAAYVLMSNIYADAGLLEQAQAVKEMRDKVGAWKKPGQSWIEHEHDLHVFMVRDGKHAHNKQLYDLLNKTSVTIKAETVCAPWQEVATHQ